MWRLAGCAFAQGTAHPYPRVIRPAWVVPRCVLLLLPIRELKRHEAHLPTKQPAPQAQDGLSGPPAHACRPQPHEASSPQGPRPHQRLSSLISGAAPSLARRRDFDALFRLGRRLRIGSLTVVRAPVEDETKVAVVAGKAVGNAVARNRAKRRIRAALRSVELPAHEHIAVLAGPGVVTAPFPALVGWLAAAFRKEVVIDA